MSGLHLSVGGQCRAARAAGRVTRMIRSGVKRSLGLPCRTLVQLQWRLGDEIMALPVYEALARLHSRDKLTVLCNYPDLLIDNPFAVPAQAPDSPDRIIDLRSGPRDVVRIEHYARLAGVPVPDSRPRLYYKDWHTPLLDSVRRPFIVIAPGASWATKRWRPENWRALADMVRETGVEVVELGVDGEQLGAGLPMAGRTSVRDAACVMHAARLSISCDSGLMHLALAAGCRVVALFGPTDPDILVRDEASFFPIRSTASCQGCWNAADTGLAPGVCREPDEMAGGRCMDLISPEQVMDKVRTLLNSM